jgi:predicted  nucleic acid-binding Zn-ribbon protein
MGDGSQSPDGDLDRTDKLPILAGTMVADDVADDAVPLEYTATYPVIDPSHPLVKPNVGRPSVADRSADVDALARAAEKARQGESVATARCHALTAELRELRGRLDAETSRLRETLAARDATIVQVLRSLAERDAQLSALQREHAQIVPALEERSKSGTQLDADWKSERARAEALAAELKTAQQSLAALRSQLKQTEADLNATRHELGVVQTQAETHLELLRTREWRQGFDQNLFRELDAEVGTAQRSRNEVQAERDGLKQRIAELTAQLTAREEAIAALKAATATEQAARARQERDLQNLDGSRAHRANHAVGDREIASAGRAAAHEGASHGLGKIALGTGGAEQSTAERCRDHRGGNDRTHGAFARGAPAAPVHRRASQTLDRGVSRQIAESRRAR